MSVKSADCDAPPASEWKSFSAEEYLSAIEKLVHLSFKTVNSNAEAGGVRVPRSSMVALPLIGVRTMLAHSVDVPMDRFEGAAKARIYSQIAEVAEGKTEGIPSALRTLILDALTKAQSEAFVHNDAVSPRVRQVLLPTGDGYLSFTPISSAGVAKLLKAAVVDHNDKLASLRKTDTPAAGAFRRIILAELPIGGSKPLNPGGLVYSMRAPIYSAFPVTHSNPHDEVLRLHRYGVSRISFPRKLLDEYADWRIAHTAQLSASSALSAVYKDLVTRMTKHVLRLGNDAYETLQNYRDHLPPGKGLVSQDLDHLQSALLVKEKRDADWASRFSRYMTERLCALPVSKLGPLFTQAEMVIIDEAVRQAITQ